MTDTKKIYSERLLHLQQHLQAEQALLVSNPFDLLYLSGFVTLTPFEREAFLFISAKHIVLFLSAFSKNVAVPHLTQMPFGYWHPLGKSLQQLLAELDTTTTLLLDTNTLTVKELDVLCQHLNPEQYNFDDITYIKELRRKKDTTEIQALRTANQVTHQALQKTLTHLKIGMSELEVRDYFESQLKRRPSQPLAFPTIVAFGDHTAIPHHQPTERKLKNNQPVLIDCGNTQDFYCADVTRTMWFGDTPSPEFLKIERVLKGAYQKAIHLITSPFTGEDVPMTIGTGGVRACDIDKVCRSFIESQGYGPNFIHTTGHGVGLYIHESPSLSSRDETPLEPAMVITIEPGIYLEGQLGYRFENSVLITPKGYEELGI